MARRQRPFALSYSDSVASTVTSGDIGLSIAAPSEGAIIDRAILSISSAGTGAGTLTAAIHERGGTKALSLTTAALTHATAANGVLGIIEGNGVPATAAGTLIDLALTFTGTISSESTIICTCTWLP